MTNILLDISTYDDKAHIPYPTVEFIKSETGEDMVFNAGDTEKAQAYIKTYTKTAFRILMQGKTQDTRNRLEYLIATNENYRYAFLEYVCSFIQDVFLAGGDGMLALTNDPNLSNTLTAKTKSFIEGGILSVDRFKWFSYSYRVGY